MPSSIREIYNKQGYYLAKGLLDPEKVEESLKEIQQLFVLQAKRHKAPITGFRNNESLLSDMESVFDKSVDSYLAAARLTGNLASVNSLMIGTEVAGIISELGIEIPVIRTGPYLNIMSGELKIPDGYFGVAAHQDWPSMQGSLDTVTVWVPLMDVDRDMYPLEIIPGSHKNGLLDGVVVQNTLEVDKSLYDERDFIPVEVEAGDAIFFSAFLIHRSGMNGRKNCVRMGCSIRFENAAEPTFVERNFPSAYKRTVVRDFITPNFPSREQVASIFGTPTKTKKKLSA